MIRLFAPILLLAATVGCSRDEQGDAAQRGRDHMQYYGCGSCHAIPGVPGAHATVGPPLDRMGVRTYIAGTLPNSRPHLEQWIEHPHRVHPGTAMPEMGVTPQDANDIAQYLERLR
jgi:cytochrome c1